MGVPHGKLFTHSFVPGSVFACLLLVPVERDMFGW